MMADGEATWRRLLDLEAKVAHLEALVMEMLTLDANDVATLTQRIEALEALNQMLTERLHALENPK